MTKGINIKPEPDFERIRRTLMLEGKPDRPPVCDFGIALEIKEWVLGRELRTVEDELEFWINAGYDYVHLRPRYDFNVVDIRDKTGSSLAEGVGVIQTMEDLHSQTWPWQKKDDVGYDHIMEMCKILPQEMKLIISTADIFTHIWEAMGFMHFCECLYTCPELIEALFLQLGEAVYTMNLRCVEEAGDKIGALWYTDDLAFNTGTFVHPDVYRKYLFPWVRKIAQLAQQLNVPFLYHTDGNLWELFEDFAEIGVNAIHPLEPKSMDPVEVKKKWGDTFCLIGNIDVDLLSRGEPEEVEAMVLDRIEKLGYDGGYCVGSSNTIAPLRKAGKLQGND